MILQESLIKQFLSKFNRPSLRVIARNTGIQVSRVQRIMNGQEMKISEYEKIKNFLHCKILTNSQKNFIEVTQKCLKQLPEIVLEDINNQLIKKLKINNYFRS